jgi:homoserine kinase type II
MTSPWRVETESLSQTQVAATMEGTLEQVLSHYRLGRLTHAHRIEQGFVNENWAITTTRGPFFVKRYPPRQRQMSLIRAQHELMEFLRLRGFPAPTLVRGLDGQTLLILDGLCYEIQEYIAGEPYDHRRPAHLEQAALTLARYHSCVEGFVSRRLCHLGHLYTPGTVRETLNRLAQAWQADPDPALASLVRKLEGRAEKLAAGFARHGALSQLVIHGDYYADNLIFRGETVVGVVDYDRARWEPRVAELAEALIYFSAPHPAHMRHIVYPGFLQWAPFYRFLEAYNYTRTLQEEEAQALPDYVGAVWLFWSLRRLLEGGPRPDFAPEALQETIALFDWAQSNAGQMTEAALSVILR